MLRYSKTFGKPLRDQVKRFDIEGCENVDRVYMKPNGPLGATVAIEFRLCGVQCAQIWNMHYSNERALFPVFAIASDTGLYDKRGSVCFYTEFLKRYEYFYDEPLLFVTLVNAWRERVDRVLAGDPEHFGMGVAYCGSLERVLAYHAAALDVVRAETWTVEWHA
jgi:hypothetical protein